jgi:DNA-binding GntR family transcriptional regulator
VDGRVVSRGVVRTALGTLSEDGNVMPKHVGATIHN